MKIVDRMAAAIPPGASIAIVAALALLVTALPSDLIAHYRSVFIVSGLLLIAMEIRTLVISRTAQIQWQADVMDRLEERAMVERDLHEADQRLRGVKADARLRYKTLKISDDILRFLRDRQLHEPLLPRPSAWHADTREMMAYSSETLAQYYERFATETQALRDKLASRDLKSDQLDMLIKYPTNNIGIRTVAEQLGALAYKLPED